MGVLSKEKEEIKALKNINTKILELIFISQLYVKNKYIM